MKVYKGNIVYTKVKEQFELIENGYIVVNDEGIILETTKELGDNYKAVECIDYGNQIIIPGFTDLHLHPNQYPNIGLGYDLELMPWIENYATPVREYFEDDNQVREILAAFITDMWKYGIIRSVQFGSIDTKTNDILFEMYMKSGLSCYLGKNHTDYKKDRHKTESTEESIRETLYLIEKYEGKSKLVHYILTPSFAPGCTEGIMQWVGNTAREKGLPIQTHLDENRSEIEMVKTRFPESQNYADVYVRNGMIDINVPTIMAHCIHCTEDEIKLLKENNIFVAHCVHSNFDLASGIMPLRRYLDEGIKVGLGSDISGGHTLNMMDIMRTTIEASKYYYVSEGKAPITVSEAFFLATKGGGAFFGKVGSFEKGYYFDALVIDDDSLPAIRKCSLKERMERFIFCADERQIKHRFCEGNEVMKPKF